MKNFPNPTKFEIRNIFPKKNWESKNGKWIKTIGRPPDIDQETKRLKNKIKMTGNTEINDAPYDIEFWVDGSTFKKDIIVPRHLIENGNYTIYNTFIKTKGTYSFKDSSGKSVSYVLEKDTIYGELSVFNG